MIRDIIDRYLKVGGVLTDRPDRLREIAILHEAADRNVILYRQWIRVFLVIVSRQRVHTPSS